MTTSVRECSRFGPCCVLGHLVSENRYQVYLSQPGWERLRQQGFTHGSHRAMLGVLGLPVESGLAAPDTSGPGFSSTCRRPPPKRPFCSPPGQLTVLASDAKVTEIPRGKYIGREPAIPRRMRHSSGAIL
jgi:hypothetical protein